MRLRLLDLDGSVSSQSALSKSVDTATHDLRSWGPKIRMSCSFGSFERFEAALATALGDASAGSPALTFYGSGDFHHVSLALVRRIQTPFNLLGLDKHPAWMGGVPVLHWGRG